MLDVLDVARNQALRELRRKRFTRGGKNNSFIDVVATDPDTGSEVTVEAMSGVDGDGRLGYSTRVVFNPPEATIKRLKALGRVVK